MDQPFPVDELLQIPAELPLVPLRDLVVLPFSVSTLLVGREESKNAVDASLKSNRFVFLVAQKNPEIDKPKKSDLHSIGTVSSILRMLKLPDGNMRVLVQGLKRARLDDFIKTEPFILAKITPLEEMSAPVGDLKAEALKRTTIELISEVIQLTRAFPPEVVSLLENVQEPGRLADIVASNLNLNSQDLQKLLEELNVIERITMVNKLLARELELLKIKQKIEDEARKTIEKSQKEYFLREQLKAIQNELGEKDEKIKEIEELKTKIGNSSMPDYAKDEAMKQVKRLESMHLESPEATVIRTYLDWLIELPWNRYSEESKDIKRAKEILDEDHYDLEKVKERIIEFLAVKSLKKEHRGPILCFVGPPGVGKTSLGKSIARALNREFIRTSLGGIRDEAEIRGHRRTYIGALPGKIIQGLKQAKTSNPVYMLDEIDKVGSDFRGDPASALLEVLDPEQNSNFVDHYINLPYDLSKVMFICTANVTHTIPPALLDRMELIFLSGYTEEEKIEIAKRYLIPKQCNENGLKIQDVTFSDEAIVEIIRGYTREAGLRNLERNIAGVLRKIAVEVVEGKITLPVLIDKSKVRKYLGPEQFIPEEEEGEIEAGVAIGLAWTPYGGEILKVEALVMKGGKGDLILTGQLGDVMKESARAALSYARSRSEQLGIDPEAFQKNDFHIHVPAGAVPKDGPSAGITISIAIISALTGMKVRRDIAMTGEITLTGRILPVGGIKEKVLAALRHNISTVILPYQNKNDVEELPPYARAKVNFQFVRNIDEVIPIVFGKLLSKASG